MHGHMNVKNTFTFIFKMFLFDLPGAVCPQPVGTIELECLLFVICVQ